MKTEKQARPAVDPEAAQEIDDRAVRLFDPVMKLLFNVRIAAVVFAIGITSSFLPAPVSAQTTSQVNWAQANPSASPSARVFPQMDYDSAHGVTVLFGGSSNSGPGNLSDTWTWDGSSWNRLSPTVSPPALAGGVMAYDSARGVSVLFGGSGNAGLSSATWEWNGSSWAQRSFGVSPPAQVWAGAAYDSVRHRMVLFEGDPNSGSPAQTWEYDGTAWTQLLPASSPSARRGPAMAFDPTRGRTVLFGGEDTTGRLAETWEWDGSKWTQIATATAPHPRFWASLAFDSQRGTSVLFGGDHIQPYDLGESNDTWEWNGAQWIEDWPAAAPPIRSGEAMAYDSARGRMVVVGGWNAATSPATIYSDTWELGSGIQTLAGTATGTLSENGCSNFGNVTVGSTSLCDAAFRLTSTGSGPLAVNSITLTGLNDFALSTDCPAGGNLLPAGSYCMTLVSFTPTAEGTRTTSIAFSFNASGGNQAFQLQGTGVVIPTALTVSPAVAMFNGGATITASLTANGAPFAGQNVTLRLPNGASVSTATDSSGVAVWFGVSVAGIHAGTYPTGIQARYAGTPAYSPSSASAQMVVTQPVSVSYTGDFFDQDSSGGSLSATIDQRTPASDTQYIDYASTPVWARFTVTGVASSTDYYARVTDASNWSTTGLGVTSVSSPALPDGAYTVIVTLVDGSGSTALSTSVASDEVRIGLVSSPTRGGYLSGGGAIAADPSANTADTRGYFSLQMKPTNTPHGNLVYMYRVNMVVGGGQLRDVNVWVTSSDVTMVSGNGSSATATGHFSVEYVDARTGQRYTGFEFTGGTYKLSAVNATNKTTAGFALVLERPDGTVFHTTAPVNSGGNAPVVPVVLGALISNL